MNIPEDHPIYKLSDKYSHLPLYNIVKKDIEDYYSQYSSIEEINRYIKIRKQKNLEVCPYCKNPETKYEKESDRYQCHCCNANFSNK